MDQLQARDQAFAEVTAQVRVPCPDLEATLAFFLAQLGFRLQMIMPADAPRIAVISGCGVTLRLESVAQTDPHASPLSLRLPCSHALWQSFAKHELVAPGGARIELVDRDAKTPLLPACEQFVLTRAAESANWTPGRAGMQYRDLIPNRLGGRYIASHIRIAAGGPVPDYVHHHRVAFQLIFCRRGWVRVVYEDQGPAFVMRAGDCVLQPPGIRHRVLEASAGLEVVEISCPAEHETFRDNALDLPTARLDPAREFGGQRFCHHIAAPPAPAAANDPDVLRQDLGLFDASGGAVDACVLRVRGEYDLGGQAQAQRVRAPGLLFIYVLEGEAVLRGADAGTHRLQRDDACVIPHRPLQFLASEAGCSLLQVQAR